MGSGSHRAAARLCLVRAARRRAVGAQNGRLRADHRGTGQRQQMPAALDEDAYHGWADQGSERMSAAVCNDRTYSNRPRGARLRCR
jgi:hypothetical protein